MSFLLRTSSATKAVAPMLRGRVTPATHYSTSSPQQGFAREDAKRGWARMKHWASENPLLSLGLGGASAFIGYKMFDHYYGDGHPMADMKSKLDSSSDKQNRSLKLAPAASALRVS